MFPSSIHEVCVSELQKNIGEELIVGTVIHFTMKASSTCTIPACKV